MPTAGTTKNGLKACSRCGESKPLSSFYRRNQTTPWVSAACIPCRAEIARERRNDPALRDRYLQQRQASHTRAYGITPERREELLVAQEGRCAICRKPFETTAHVDHDHRCCPEKKRSCGQCVRGLLCSNCNTGLGAIGDDVERLQALLRYLGRCS